MNHSAEVMDFDPQAIVDTCAMTAADVDSVLPVLPHVPTVVLSSLNVYQAYAALLAGRCDAAVPLIENSELRGDRYLYRGQNLARVPNDYSKRDVEDRWLPRGAVVLRLPLSQHLLVCLARAQQLLGWAPADPVAKVTQSVRWHLAHPPTGLTATDEEPPVTTSH